MSVAVLADAHIGGPGGPAEPLVRQLDDLRKEGCSRLLVLGDLFQVWVGDTRYETADVVAVTAALRRLVEAGVAIDYVEGNRDFFLEGSSYADLFHHLGSEVAFESAGRRYLAVHGDGLNERDRQYLFWRWLSKSRLSRFLMFRLPASLARRFVIRAERGLAETNFKHKVEIPERAILDYALRRLQGGFDILLLGHFHEPRRWQVEGGEVWLLDAWFRSRQIEWIGG